MTPFRNLLGLSGRAEVLGRLGTATSSFLADRGIPCGRQSARGTLVPVGIIGEIATPPDGGWTGRELVDALLTHQYAGPDRRRDPDLPAWARDILVLADLETHLQMEGLLGWWESRAADDLALVCAALTAVGMPDQAELLEQAERVLPLDELAQSSTASVSWSISSFAERHPDVTAEQLSGLQRLEERLWCNEPSGADLYELLTTHASDGLAAHGR